MMMTSMALLGFGTENLKNFYESLKVMGFGMTGIFVVLFLIYLSVIALIKLFPDKDSPK